MKSMQTALKRARSRGGCVLLTIALMACLSAGETAAQGAAAYLKLGVGARALGMGGAFTAVADDATSVHWNPAGLATLKQNEIAGMHAQLSLDRRFDFVGYATPHTTGTDAWGVSYTRFSIDGIPETRVHAPGTMFGGVDVGGQPVLTDDQFDAAGSLVAQPGLGTVKIFSLFDDVEQSLTGSYSRKVGDRLYLGATGRYLKQSLFSADGSGLGVDAGALYRASDDWTLGFTLKDLFEELSFGGGLQDAKVDMTASAGAAYRGIKDTLLSAEFTRTGDRATKLRAGAERWFGGKYAVRAGVNKGKVSAGASLRVSDWQFDYAYQAQNLGDIQRLSFAYRF